MMNCLATKKIFSSPPIMCEPGQEGLNENECNRKRNGTSKMMDNMQWFDKFTGKNKVRILTELVAEEEIFSTKFAFFHYCTSTGTRKRQPTMPAY